MKIGELARATRTTAETIRYYERSGLLDAPPRSEGNYRIYTPAHVERLSFIRHCRNLDMTLDEIRALLRFQQEPLQNCAQINDLLDEHIAHVAARIRELQALEIQARSPVLAQISPARPIAATGDEPAAPSEAREANLFAAEPLLHQPSLLGSLLKVRLELSGKAET